MSHRAILLVNLGSPDSTSIQDVRRYLDQFLMDPFVIQLPWILRRLIVSLLVLPRRPAASSEAYRSVWMQEGSPLLVLSRRLLEALRNKLDLPVSLAMRYGNPGIESQILELAGKEGVSEILLIPLYPHFADSTVTTSITEARRVIDKFNLPVRLLVHEPFYEDNRYIEALVTSARPWLDKSDYDHIVFSYHGLPVSHLKKADPTGNHCLAHADCCNTPSSAHASCYRHQVLRTTQCFIEQSGLDRDFCSVTFQSRLGRAKWLEPSTETMLQILAQQGKKRLLVLCPAFVTDCLETLEEIAIQGEKTFVDAGGESLTLIPCLNDNPKWVEVLAHWCKRVY